MPQDSAPEQSFASMSAVVKPAAPVATAAMPCSSSCLKGALLSCNQALDRFDEIPIAKRRVERGVSLYHDGDAFASLYAVCYGAFKTVYTSRQGNEKVTGFHLAGEMLGLEAINIGHHGHSAVALEDSEVCAIPFAALEKRALAVPALQHQLFRILSSDISRDQGLMLLLGRMSAEQRLAAFLLNLSRRYQRLGFAANRFMLPMTRGEIGSYIGLTVETVSRLLTHFQFEGLIGVDRREIELKQAGRLRDMVGH